MVFFFSNVKDSCGGQLSKDVIKDQILFFHCVQLIYIQCIHLQLVSLIKLMIHKGFEALPQTLIF